MTGTIEVLQQFRCNAETFLLSGRGTLDRERRLPAMLHPRSTAAQKIGAKALRLAVANLLRLAAADLDDARLLLRQGRTRNAAGLVVAALDQVIRAVVASERGRRGDRGEFDLAAVPEDNPVRSGIAAARALPATPKDALVKPNGSLVPEPEAAQVSDALDHLASTLNTVTQAFEVDMEGADPAGRVTPIRSEPPPQPKQPRLPAPPGATPRPADKCAPATRAAKQKKVGSKRNQELAPSRSRTVDRRSSPDRRQQAPAPVPLRTVDRETKGAAPASPVSAPVTRAAPRWPNPARSEQFPHPTARIVQQPESPRERRTGTASSVLAPEKSTNAVPVDPAVPSRRPPDASSTEFWSLMDRWRVEDLAALDLIGHSGGLSKKGTRPRFRLPGEKAPLFHLLREIDAALGALGAPPDVWLRRSIASTPFSGATPLQHISVRGQQGARDVIRRIMKLGLLGPVGSNSGKVDG
jgi:hypothetical protein